mmetsp:Transcript_24383/g.44154  ORF Transcript_24383/g.44154 Transcript_24383/m.44154 type:complete len:506 (+) Transcript_24383:65-1582(+)
MLEHQLQALLDFVFDPQGEGSALLQVKAQGLSSPKTSAEASLDVKLAWFSLALPLLLQAAILLCCILLRSANDSKMSESLSSSSQETEDRNIPFSLLVFGYLCIVGISYDSNLIYPRIDADMQLLGGNLEQAGIVSSMYAVGALSSIFFVREVLQLPLRTCFILYGVTISFAGALYAAVLQFRGDWKLLCVARIISGFTAVANAVTTVNFANYGSGRGLRRAFANAFMVQTVGQVAAPLYPGFIESLGMSSRVVQLLETWSLPVLGLLYAAGCGLWFVEPPKPAVKTDIAASGGQVSQSLFASLTAMMSLMAGTVYSFIFQSACTFGMEIIGETFGLSTATNKLENSIPVFMTILILLAYSNTGRNDGRWMIVLLITCCLSLLFAGSLTQDAGFRLFFLVMGLALASNTATVTPRLCNAIRCERPGDRWLSRAGMTFVNAYLARAGTILGPWIMGMVFRETPTMMLLRSLCLHICLCQLGSYFLEVLGMMYFQDQQKAPECEEAG